MNARLLLVSVATVAMAACGGGSGNYTLEATLDCMEAKPQVFMSASVPSDENPDGTGAEGSFDTDVIVGSDISEVVAVFERSENDASRALALRRDEDLRLFGVMSRPELIVRNVVLWSGGLASDDEELLRAEVAVAAVSDCLG